MTTVNTNQGALIALQNLNRTNSELETVQNRINTGLRVASAKDDGGIFAIAQRIRGDLGGFEAVQNSLRLGQSTVDTALAAGEAISDLLIELREKALASADTSIDAASRASLNEDFIALRDQITNIVNNAEFNGTNLINNSVTSVAFLANADGSNTIRVQDEDFRLTGTVITITASTDISTQTEAAAAATALETSLNNVNNALSRLGTASKSLEIQSEFVTKLSDQLEVGLGNLVDADLARESSRLQALQVRQQLGIQALSIANQAPSTILGFFR